MPRRSRNYAEEYARRIQREQERAEREKRPFSRTRARGHLTREYERAQVRERKQGPRAPTVDRLDYWIRKTAFGIPDDDYRILVDEAIGRLADDDSDMSRRKARTWMVARLRQKYADTLEFLARVQSGMTFRQAADGPPQSQGQLHYFTGRVEYVGVEVYWYHGNR